MDALKDKLKKLSLLGSSGKAKGAFQGTGHRLGGSDGTPAPVRAPQPQPAARPRVVVPPPPAAASSSQAATQQQPKQQQQQTPPPPQQQQQAPAAPQPQPRPPAPAPPPADDHPAGEAVALAASQLASDPSGAAAAEVLSRLLGNVLGSPAEPKFRRVRLSNPKIAAAVVEASGGVELLLACGFEIVFEEAPGGGAGGGSEEATEGYAVLPAEADLAPLQHALRLLAPRLPAGPTSSGAGGSVAAASSSPASIAPSSSGGVQQQAAAAPQRQQAQPPARRAQREREWDPPRERNTQVLLPTSVERDVPDWFFQRTGQELKAAFLSATRRREQDQVLMTRATRERLKGAPRPEAAFATVRVRFPEGISLQGEFSAGEPVAALFAWVADSLADPLHTYDLVLPSRQPLEPAPQSVREAGLLPSVVLLFRWTGASAQEMAAVPALRADLLRAARPAPVAY